MAAGPNADRADRLWHKPIRLGAVPRGVTVGIMLRDSASGRHGLSNTRARSLSTGPSTPVSPNHTPAQRNPRIILVDVVEDAHPYMLAAPIDLSRDDDSDWLAPTHSKLHRTASVGNSWGVTSIGGGYSWSKKATNSSGAELDESDHSISTGSFIQSDSSPDRDLRTSSSESQSSEGSNSTLTAGDRSHTDSFIPNPPQEQLERHGGAYTAEPDSTDAMLSRSPYSSSAVSLSSLRTTPEVLSPNHTGESGSSSRPPMSRSPTQPRPRRRSSKQRVSLVAGRVSIVSIDPPTEPDLLTPMLTRYGSQSSFLSVASTTTPPSPTSEKETFLGGRSISEFVIEGELGRGAYGVVKRAREMNTGGDLGVCGLAVFYMRQIDSALASGHHKANH